MGQGLGGLTGRENDQEAERPVDRVIAAIITAIDASEAVDSREWVARHPEFAPELEEFFADLATVGDHFRKIGPVDSSVTASVTPGREYADGADTIDKPPATGQDLPAGARAFGRCYTLLKMIGGGGQGAVWKAFQSNPDRLVAIKIVKGGYLAAPEDVRRFRYETEIISRLDHPHVIPVYEVGEDRGHHYFSMKLMGGGSLAQRLPAYRNWPAGAAELIVQIAETVEHAHKHGVIHRDLKPSNVMFDSEGRPYLTDFGLAKLFGEVVEATESGSVVGTAAYMSPEQASGKKGVVTTASDVYGLGATLYAVLTGRPPFTGDSVVEILDRVREGDPVSPAKVNPEVPRDLAAICLKCLERVPTRRYESALKVAEDLRNWREGKPTVARPVGLLERLGKWCRRRPGLAAALTAVVFVAALGLVGIAWQLRATRQALAAEARTHYFKDIALAEQAWAENNFGRAAELLAGCRVEQRGWEWYYLMGQRHRPPLRFNGHEGSIYGVDFSPDGRCLASAGRDKTIKVWDAATGRPICTLEGQRDVARAVAFSPDGRRLASGSWDGNIRVWDIATGQLVYEPLAGHKGRVISVDYSPDGRSLASGGEYGSLRIWDAATGLALQSLRAHQTALLGVAYSPDGRSLVSVSDDGVVKVWGAKDGRPILTSPEKIEIPRCVAFSPDGLHLAVACGDGAVRVLDARTGRLVFRSGSVHTDAVRTVAYSPHGTRLASASGDGTVKLWDAATGQEAISLQVGRNVLIRCVAFGRSGTGFGRLAAADDDGTIRIWEASRATSPFDALRIFACHRGVVYGLAYSPDGRHIATAGGDRTVRIWEAETGREIHVLSEHASQVYAVVYSPDGQRLVSASADKLLRIWDATTGRLVNTLAGHSDDIWCVAYSPDGRFLASGDGEGAVKVWQVASSRSDPVQTLAAHHREVWCVAFSPDGKTLAIGCSGGEVKCWAVTSGRLAPRPPLKGHVRNVYGLTFSPDGRQIASAGEDGFIRTWDVRTGSPSPTRTCLARCDGLGFSPDGAYLVGANGDGTLKVWDARSDRQEPLLVLYGHASRVLSVAFSSDGRRLVSAGFDGTARVWDTTGWPPPLGDPRTDTGR